MEIVIPNRDFDFHSARSSPHATAPSTPKRFGEYCFTAPPSPQHLSEFYRDFDDFYVDGSSGNSEIPIGWEEEPKFKRERTIFEDDFAFDVSGEFEKMTLPAEELFDGGKIRPLKPPSKLDHRNRADEIEVYNSPKKKKDLNNSATERERGRDRNPSSLSSSSSRRGSRSLSPYRVSKYPWEEVEEEQRRQRKPPTKQSSFLTKPTLNSTSSSLSTTSTTKNGSRKWRLKDFFLFRSASEGRTSNKDPLRKYTALFRKHDEVKSSSFRSNDGANNSKRRGAVSAHELHYTKNRAVSEDLKKKTFLPYKQGILGRLSFNPAVHALSNGFGFSRK